MQKPFQSRGSGCGPFQADWLKARQTARELDRVLDAGRARKDAIVRVAAELHLTTRQIYNLLARYQAERRITALLPRLPLERRKRLHLNKGVRLQAIADQLSILRTSSEQLSR